MKAKTAAPRSLALPASVAAAALVLASAPAALRSQGDDRPDPNRVAAERPLAILAETAEWVDIFNGVDLSGWTGDTENHSARDGLLICEKGGRNLYTEKDYADFAFTFEFKLEESGNNGIGIRVPEGGRPAQDGMEIQILDDDGERYTKKVEMGGRERTLTWLKPWQVHGAVYGIAPAATGYLNPVGEWNEQTIIAIEDHIMVILNGALIVDVFLEDVQPLEPAFQGKDRRSGKIALAGHNDYVEFRNLRVAEFNPSPPLIEGGEDNVPPPGFAALFNGKDLEGWKGLAHRDANVRRALEGDELAAAQAEADERMRAHWSVVEGILTYDGEGANLCTVKEYGDFEMYCDWMIPPGADSGIYLRGTPQVQIWDPWDPRTEDGSLPATAEGWVEQYRNGRNLGSGGLWNNRRARNSPLVLADRPTGEWNTFYIRMIGERVSVWLNGELVVDRTKLENVWDRDGRIAPLPRADQIELQHHGSELFFKNIYLRELPY